VDSFVEPCHLRIGYVAPVDPSPTLPIYFGATSALVRPHPEKRLYLARLLKKIQGLAPAIELRHHSWIHDRIFEDVICSPEETKITIPSQCLIPIFKEHPFGAGSNGPLEKVTWVGHSDEMHPRASLIAGLTVFIIRIF
jgi:hypothetical protein